MEQSRRSLLKMGVLTAASAALPVGMLAKSANQTPAAPVTAPAANAYDALSTLTAADFKPFVGSTFTVQSQASTVRLTLAEVQNPPTLSAGAPAPTGKADPRSQTFALRFKSSSGPALSQGTYTFQNKSIGNFAMFIVPSQAKANPMYYTGQVNRPTQ
jgi:hypothetical protein